MINNYNSFKIDTQNTNDISYNKSPTLNSNLLIDKNNSINQNTKANDKKVSFNNKVVEVNVESYKDYNKLNSYGEEEIYENLQMKDQFYNKIEKKSTGNSDNSSNYNNNYSYNNNNNNNVVQAQPKKENECCCQIF